MRYANMYNCYAWVCVRPLILKKLPESLELSIIVRIFAPEITLCIIKFKHYGEQW